MNNIPIPPRMQHLKRDKRGLPIPAIALIDTDGRPHFTINDETKRHACIRENRCHLCGLKLFRFKWMVGGPASAFMSQGMYIDGPTHHECMRYAVMTCPYLAAKHYDKRIDAKTLDPDKAPDRMIYNDPTMTPVRPTVFVAIKFERFEVHGNVLNPMQYIQPHRPLMAMEFWQQGQQLSPQDGLEASFKYLVAERYGGDVNPDEFLAKIKEGVPVS